MATLPLIVLLVVLLTSVLSGIVGMAGGMILMAVLIVVYSVPLAMMLHGVTQASANGSRAWFLRDHIRWHVLPPYLVGAGACVALFASVALVPDQALVLMLVGALPWLALGLPARMQFDVERRATAAGCGAVVTAAQLLAGASGPLLDLFFQNSRLDRHQIVATKAVTQTIGHLIKLGYYGTLLVTVGTVEELASFGGSEAPAWLFLTVVPVAVLGTLVGTRILDRVTEPTFRRLSSRIMLALGVACVASGVLDLLDRV